MPTPTPAETSSTRPSTTEVARARRFSDLLSERRDRFALSTKYSVSRDRDDPNAAGNHRESLRLSLETSLRRLRTSYVDIYWVHMWDRHMLLEETMRALDDEARAGKILYLGVSDTRLGGGPGEHPGAVARADRLHQPAGAVQPAPARHRARAPADGRGDEHDARRLEPTR